MTSYFHQYYERNELPALAIFLEQDILIFIFDNICTVDSASYKFVYKSDLKSHRELANLKDTSRPFF